MSELIQAHWYQAFQVIWTFATAITSYLLWRAAKQQAKERKEKQELEGFQESTVKDLRKLGRDIDRLEGEIRHLPTHEDIRRLTEKIEGTNKALSEMIGEFRAINTTVKLVNQHLMNRGETQ